MHNIMTEKKKGGYREGSGRKLKGSAKRITASVCLDPDNVTWLAGMGAGKNDYLNRLLDAERQREKIIEK